MSASEILAIVTCINSALTLIVVTVAFLPQVKQVLAVVRDVVLWSALLFVLGFSGWTAWSRWSGPSNTDTATGDTAASSEPAWSIPARTPETRTTVTYDRDF